MWAHAHTCKWDRTIFNASKSFELVMIVRDRISNRWCMAATERGRAYGGHWRNTLPRRTHTSKHTNAHKKWVAFTLHRKKRNEMNVNDALLAMRNCHIIRSSSTTTTTAQSNTYARTLTHTQQTKIWKRKIVNCHLSSFFTFCSKS